MFKTWIALSTLDDNLYPVINSNGFPNAYLLHYVVNYPVDSAIYSLNNRVQGVYFSAVNFATEKAMLCYCERRFYD